ncbi:MAG: hypothetical protein S4CHLAM45_00330 [Chlamydiales bacterium]|nr:hypothetical protein [Chlamydiales bacterium]MCH9619358.1 hypothetical protein [Chlamydiales bacterium]MCH9622162.1 hypothetical protein [Chlamydiales bacterium]
MTMEKEHMLKLIKEFYEKSHPEEKAYLTFERYKREGINVSTLPWYNKEIFIKYYLPGEGRDLDNQHSEPYLGIQVRYDRDLKKQVTFDQTQVENYLRD